MRHPCLAWGRLPDGDFQDVCRVWCLMLQNPSWDCHRSLSTRHRSWSMCHHPVDHSANHSRQSLPGLTCSWFFVRGRLPDVYLRARRAWSLVIRHSVGCHYRHRLVGTPHLLGHSVQLPGQTSAIWRSLAGDRLPEGHSKVRRAWYRASRLLRHSSGVLFRRSCQAAPPSVGRLVRQLSRTPWASSCGPLSCSLIWGPHSGGLLGREQAGPSFIKPRRR